MKNLICLLLNFVEIKTVLDGEHGEDCELAELVPDIVYFRDWEVLFDEVFFQLIEAHTCFWLSFVSEVNKVRTLNKFDKHIVKHHDSERSEMIE